MLVLAAWGCHGCHGKWWLCGAPDQQQRTDSCQCSSIQLHGPCLLAMHAIAVAPCMHHAACCPAWLRRELLWWWSSNASMWCRMPTCICEPVRDAVQHEGQGLLDCVHREEGP
jgi:hypothetical protein